MKSKEINHPIDVKEAALNGDLILATKRGIDLLDQKIILTKKEMEETTKNMGISANNDLDLRENYEFRDLRIKAQFELPKKIFELNSQRKKAIEYNEENNDNVIGFGSKFTAEMYFSGEVKPEVINYHLLGPLEASFCDQFDTDDDMEIISYISPLGRVVWNHNYKNNPTCKYKTETGETKCTIIKVF